MGKKRKPRKVESPIGEDDFGPTWKGHTLHPMCDKDNEDIIIDEYNAYVRWHNRKIRYRKSRKKRKKIIGFCKYCRRRTEKTFFRSSSRHDLTLLKSSIQLIKDALLDEPGRFAMCTRCGTSNRYRKKR